MVGIWFRLFFFGTTAWFIGGVVHKPPADQFILIPQRPYLPIGTLRDQVIYPHNKSEMEDRKLGLRYPDTEFDGGSRWRDRRRSPRDPFGSANGKRGSARRRMGCRARMARRTQRRRQAEDCMGTPILS